MIKFKKLRKRLLIILTILMVILAYLFHIPNVKSITIKNEEHIRIMSYNIKYGASDYDEWQERKKLIAEQILEYKPDSIGIQEGDWYWMHSGEGLPELLTGYSYVGVGRDDGEMSGEYAAIFYNHNNYEVIDSGNFWLSETPEVPSIGWDAVAYRICTWVILRDKTSGEEYAHFNTHLDHVGEIAREESVKLLIEKVGQLDIPYVITGDFNLFEKSDEYDFLIETNIIEDSKYATNDSMNHGTINWFLPINFQLLKPIDFCFVSTTDWLVHSYRVDNTYRVERIPVSDHYPIIVDLSLLLK